MTIRVVIFLLFGAVLNVAVAWTFAVFVDSFGVRHFISGSAPMAYGDDGYVVEAWFAARTTVPGATSYASRWQKDIALEIPGSYVFHIGRDPSYFSGELNPADLLPAWTRLGPPEEYFSNGEANDLYFHLMAAGWPVRALCCTWGFDVEDNYRCEYRHGLRIGFLESSNTPRLLPLRLLPLGFTVNTLFYTAALWLVITIPKMIRRYFSKSDNHCHNCNYDLRGAEHTVCPECGERA